MMPKGHKLTDEQRRYPSKFQKNQIPWNKGSGGCKRGHDPKLYVPMPSSGVYVCLGCKRENGAKYRQKNKNKPDYIIKNRVARYKISSDDYKNLLNLQNGRCAVCGIKLNLKNARIDHCHKTENVRGLLCVSCNTGIGLFRDSPEILKSAAKYVEKNDCKLRDQTAKAA